MQALPFKVLWKCKPSHLWFFGIIDEYDFVYTTFYHKSTDKHVPLGMFEDVSGPLNIKFNSLCVRYNMLSFKANAIFDTVQYLLYTIVKLIVFQ